MPGPRVRAPHAETSPWVWSFNCTAAPGSTVTEVGSVITSAAPSATPTHGPPAVHVVPAGSTTTFAPEPPGSSGRANTAPPGGGFGTGDVRRHAGSVGALTAIDPGPHLAGLPRHTPSSALAVTKLSSTPEPSRFARPIAPPPHWGGVSR